MDNDAYIRQRTDDILRQRIALGMTAGGARRKRSGSKTVRKPRRSTKQCPARKVARKAYVRKDGTRVRATCAKRRRVGGEDMMEGYGEGVMAGARRRVYRRRAGEDVMAGVRAGARPRKLKAKRAPSKWVQFVKRYAMDNGVPYCVALQEASVLWDKETQRPNRRLNY